MTGAFNLAAEPVLDAPALGRLFRARPVELDPRLLRALVSLSWKLRLQPTSPGWLDMGLRVPTIDTTRTRSELRWTPKFDCEDAILELLQGMREGAGLATPPLDPAASGPLRRRELRAGVGARSM